MLRPGKRWRLHNTVSTPAASRGGFCAACFTTTSRTDAAAPQFQRVGSAALRLPLRVLRKPRL